jgi:hypothetical protein
MVRRRKIDLGRFDGKAQFERQQQSAENSHGNHANQASAHQGSGMSRCHAQQRTHPSSNSKDLMDNVSPHKSTAYRLSMLIQV